MNPTVTERAQARLIAEEVRLIEEDALRDVQALLQMLAHRPALPVLIRDRRVGTHDFRGTHEL